MDAGEVGVSAGVGVGADLGDVATAVAGRPRRPRRTRKKPTTPAPASSARSHTSALGGRPGPAAGRVPLGGAIGGAPIAAGGTRPRLVVLSAESAFSPATAPSSDGSADAPLNDAVLVPSPAASPSNNAEMPRGSEHAPLPSSVRSRRRPRRSRRRTRRTLVSRIRATADRGRTAPCLTPARSTSTRRCGRGSAPTHSSRRRTSLRRRRSLLVAADPAPPPRWVLRRAVRPVVAEVSAGLRGLAPCPLARTPPPGATRCESDGDAPLAPEPGAPSPVPVEPPEVTPFPPPLGPPAPLDGCGDAEGDEVDGLEGSEGAEGIEGTDGTDGAEGADGAEGTDGFTGEAGSGTGTSGTGTAGAPGSWAAASTLPAPAMTATTATTMLSVRNAPRFST